MTWSLNLSGHTDSEVEEAELLAEIKELVGKYRGRGSFFGTFVGTTVLSVDDSFLVSDEPPIAKVHKASGMHQNMRALEPEVIGKSTPVGDKAPQREFEEGNTGLLGEDDA